MNIKNEYDVFIAYHNSGKEIGSGKEAEKIYDFLNRQGLHCFLFSHGNNTIYKANFIKIMQSKLFLFVCNENIDTKSNGEIDYKKNYHLYVELDTFYALAQSDKSDSTINDSAIAYCTKQQTKELSQSPECLHPLFNNRNSFFFVDADNEDTLEQISEWVFDRLESSFNNEISNEVIAVLNGRGSDVLSQKIEGINFQQVFRKAIEIRCVGISNWTFSLTDGCKKLIGALGRNTKVEMLFLDPNGINVEIRKHEEQKDIRQQITNSFDMIKSELINKFGCEASNRENLSLYIYDMIPRDNIIFIYTKEDAYAFVQSYSHALPGSACPCIVVQKNINNQDSPLFKCYEQIYTKIKKHAEPINIFEEKECI